MKNTTKILAVSFSLLLLFTPLVVAQVSGGGSASSSPPALIITEFLDYQDPFTYSFYTSNFGALQVEYGNKIVFEYKHFPLEQIHPQARKAAEAAECVRDQSEERFVGYHYNLLNNRNNLDIETLRMLVEHEEVLEMERFNNCLDSGEKAAVVEQHKNEGLSLGVAGTPTFFIGSQTIVGAQPSPTLKYILSFHSPPFPPVLLQHSLPSSLQYSVNSV